ncbi:hypothetical protein [Aeromonas hydrophila]|uniref:hypothetical protein n=1 Tax=Aeromonas hydrophila TaxID=644 RepID=UPI003EC5DF1E
MFKSNKTWRCKKPDSLLIMSFLSIFLLSCSLSDSQYSSSEVVSNLTHSNSLFSTAEKVSSQPSTVHSSLENSNLFIPKHNNNTEFLNSNKRVLLQNDICLPYPLSSVFHCEINNYNNSPNLFHDDSSASDKLIANIAKNITDNEKDKGFSLGDYLGLLGFLFGLANFYYARYLEISKEIDTYRREFWLKQVLFPGYIDNLKLLITDARTHIDASNGDPVKLWTCLLPHFNKVRDGSNFFISYQADFNLKINGLIDDLEDSLSEHANQNNNIVDASALFRQLQSFVDQVFYMLDEIYSGDKEKLSMFALSTIKKVLSIH